MNAIPPLIPAAKLRPVEPITTGINMEQMEESFKSILASQFQQQEALMAKQIQSTIQEEVEAKVLPAVRKVVQESLASSILRPIQSSIDQLATTGVHVNKAEFADAVASSIEETCLIPLPCVCAMYLSLYYGRK